MFTQSKIGESCWIEFASQIKEQMIKREPVLSPLFIAGDISPLCSLFNNYWSIKLRLNAGCAVWVQGPLDSWIKVEFHQRAFPPRETGAAEQQ